MDTNDPNKKSRVIDEAVVIRETIREVLAKLGKDESCEAHVALVIDESGSILNTGEPSEADLIRDGLQNLINQELNSNLTISFIGMSHSDDNSRTDHVLEMKVTDHSKPLFETWINNYRDGSVDDNSDWWASGV